ncbi:MAG: aminodeoxychorismate/anthranilate synthase component II [Flavobacteriales bacterium]|nr:aminodeoxychorismate/anthranilate synthase component II [Flavobacteriales bacterium]
MPKVLLFDSYDSFTYNLKDYLEQCGASVFVIRNDEMPLEKLVLHNFDGIVISPGPQTPEKSGILMEVLDYFYNKKPILGICLGHQAIGIYGGMNLVKMDEPVHGKVSFIKTKKHPMFEGISQELEVCRYHSLVLENKQTEHLEITAETIDHKIMALAHKTLPVWGLQFHPEAILTQYGLKMIQNWLRLL